MTPQMQQSIQLLQMNSMDLEMMIREEMMENPFLEMGDDEEDLQSEPDPATDGAELIAPDAPTDSGLSDDNRNTATPPDDEPEPTGPLAEAPPATDSEAEFLDPANSAEGSEDFQKMAEVDTDWSEQFEDGDNSSYTSTREDREDNDFTTYTSLNDSLYDSLKRQLHLSVLSGRNFEIGEFIIGNLNTDGYLDSSFPNQCLMLGYPQELITPDEAGSTDKVDETLRRMLAKLHGGENPDAFIGMKRRELTIRIIASILKVTYDEIASLKKDDQLLRLIAHRMKRPHEELAGIPPSEMILEVIAFRLRTTPDVIFDVLEIIQDFEPTGVAARDLAECLRLQCEDRGIRNKVLYRVLDEHLEDLQQKRFREVARALEVTEDEVTEVFNILSHLNPKPGSSTTKDRPQYISPDVYVKKVDGKYLYFLNEGDAGRLKVASNYRRLLMSKAARKAAAAEAAEAAAHNGAAVAALPAEGQWEEVAAAPVQPIDHDYVSEKYKNAVWLIRNIEKRKSTILRVTEAIMEYQKDFLEKGIEFLHPLTLRDIAERVGMHESTIARVTTKKYVETPRGIFELKYFFSSGLETDDGEAASSRSIKELLTQMIEAEDKRRPLSDQKVADMLRQKGFQIARRTVAKYREQLRILPAKLRKEVK